MLVAIHGAYYDNNFGDLLLMKIYENWIRATVDADVVYPMVPKNQLNKFKSHFPKASVGLRQRKSWKALFYAGGGHFGEPNSNARSVYSNSWNQRFFKRHVLPAELCLWSSIPYAISGVGVGPLSNFWVRQEVKRIFFNAKTLSVRDTDSKQFVQNVLRIGSDVEVIPDAALTITKSDIPEKIIENINSLLKPYQGMLLLGIHHPREFLGENFQAKFLRASLLASLASAPDVMPVVFADNGRSDCSEPCENLAKLIQTHTGRKCLTVPFQGVWETVALISRLSAVLSTKLHVGIVAYALGVYCESFAMHSKVIRFYSQIDRSSQCLMLEDVNEDTSMQKIERAIKAARDETSVRDTKWQGIREAASLNQKLISSFLRAVF